MSGVQSIQRAFAVLRALAVGPAGVTELAERVELPKSTVSRLLAALEDEGAVVQDETGGDYGLGSALADLAGSTTPGYNLVAAARPHLIELAEQSGEAAGLSVLDGDEVYYLDHVESDHDVLVRSWTGERAPLHAVPSGLVILAHASAAATEAYLARPLEAPTHRTVTDPARILDRLTSIRSTGYAWVYEEFAEGINSVAAPIFSSDGQVRAALHVHGPSYRFPKTGSEDELAAMVVDTAARLSAQLDAR